MQKPLVGVVVLNWNRIFLTEECIRSVRKQTYAPYKIIVVDNGSTDGSIDRLEALGLEELITNATNKGFATAINQGFVSALENGCDYIVSLNNDATIEPGWLEELVSYMEDHPEISFGQGSSMQKESPSIFDSSGIYLERGFIPNQRGLGQENPQTEIPAIGPNAAGAIYRRELLETVAISPGEFFDERFFAYVEDVDFNLRCTLRGHKYAFIPKATLHHIGSATGNSIAKKKMYWGARNMIWLVYKNASVGILKSTSKTIARSHLANLQFLWREQRGNFIPYLRGLFVGILLLPLFVRKRNANLRLQSISDADFMDLLVPSNPPLSNPLKRLINLIK